MCNRLSLLSNSTITLTYLATFVNAITAQVKEHSLSNLNLWERGHKGCAYILTDTATSHDISEEALGAKVDPDNSWYM